MLPCAALRTSNRWILIGNRDNHAIDVFHMILKGEMMLKLSALFFESSAREGLLQAPQALIQC